MDAALQRSGEPVPEYIFQAVERGEDGSVEFVCHESDFKADDLESAIVTANALLEVIPVADKCNRIQVLDEGGNVLWSRLIEAHEHAG